MAIKVVSVVDRVGAAGGGERVAVDIATGLDRGRFDSLLCVTRPSDPTTLAAIRATGIDVLELDRTSRFSLLPWLRLVRMLRRSRVQVLHSHKFGSNAWTAVLARLAGVPVFVAHEHSWAFTGNRLRTGINRHVVAPRAGAIVAVSALDGQRLVELGGVPRGRVVVCPNGVPDGHGNGDVTALRDELALPPEALVVGIVAGLRPEKRIDLLIRAAALLHGPFPDLRVVVVGDGPEQPSLVRLAAMLGLADVVRFAGRREDATDFLPLFDVAVLTSDREGSPLALLEYMAARRPIVATCVGGVPELVADDMQALLVPPGGVDAIAGAIERLLRDRALAAELGARAGERHAAEFRLASAVGRVELLYERLLS